MPYKPDFDLIRFDDKDDKLNRRESAILITDYLLSQTDSKVISINSAWGTGKTWFVHMWKNELRKNPDYQEKVIPIYYNAWENDDYADALIPLLSEINRKFIKNRKQKYPPEQYLNLFWRGVFKFIYAVFGIFFDSIDKIIEKISFGLLDLKLRKIPITINSILKDEEHKKPYNEQFQKYEKHFENKNKFSEAINKFLKPNEKIYIFVDELDRCRPTFAIETLERIKHFFDIEKVHFIIFQDSEQLSHSVKVIYGEECDTVGYLSRFFDLNLNLPSVNYMDLLINIFDERIVKYLIILNRYYKLSIRDFEKFQQWFFFYYNNGKIQGYESDECLFLLIYFFIFKTKYPSDNNKIIIDSQFDIRDVFHQYPFTVELNQELEFGKYHPKGIFDIMKAVIQTKSETELKAKFGSIERGKELKILVKNLPKTLNIFDFK